MNKPFPYILILYYHI